MRYTTIIDITEFAGVWASASCRELYLYLVLKSGWHDDDRDMIRASIRQLSAATGLTKSAVEHAIRQLTKAGLLAKEGQAYRVTKWTLQPKPSPRPRQDQQRAAAANSDVARQWELQLEESRRRLIHVVTNITKEEGLQWIQEVEDGRYLKHGGCTLPRRKDWLDWLKKEVSKK